jgi:chemotaxis protein MotB
VKVEIGAHTDDQPLKAGGAFADNDALSQARAESVKAYLVKKGVGEDQIVAKGYGSTKPAQDPTGLKGGKLAAVRKANQRVELQLVTPEAAPAQAAPAAEAPKTE